MCFPLQSYALFAITSQLTFKNWSAQLAEPLVENMFIFKHILIISGLCRFSFANLKIRPKPDEQLPKKKVFICSTNETGYSVPLPINLEVEVYFKNVIKIDEDLNLISIQADLWTYWSDPGLAINHG